MTTNNTKKAILTLTEAAEFLHVSMNTLRNWDRNETLKAMRATPKSPRRYLKTDLEEFLKQQKK